MRGIFSSAVVTTNEDYKKVVKDRMKIFTSMGAVASFTIIASLLISYLWADDIREGMLDVYLGFGGGLLAISILFWVMHWRMLRNEGKLKEGRIKYGDERLIEIGNRSMRFAGIMMIGSMYITTLIVGLFNTFLFTILLINMCVLILAYAAAYRYYLRKM